MKTTKKLMFTLLAGATLGLASPSSPIRIATIAATITAATSAMLTGTPIAGITRIAATRLAPCSSSARITCNAR